jgi:hypothetical protein
VGTTVQWMRVLEPGGIWGLLMFLFLGIKSKRESFSRFSNLAALAFTPAGANAIA